MINVGFIGVGGMGTAQSRGFAPLRGCRIAAAADPSSENLARFAELHGDLKTYDDHRRLLDDPDIDAVVIATPTGLHKAVASDALEAGKPTLLEKPMARTVAECRALNRLAEKTGVLLMIAHCRRYDPHWGAWGKFVTSGKIGRPILWRHVMASPGPKKPWFMDDRMGGGPLLDGAVHNYDFANLIFGDPESVVSSAINLRPEVTGVDAGSAVVRYQSGDQLLVSWSWGAAGTGCHDVIGPKGFLEPTPAYAPPDDEKGKFRYVRVTPAKGKQRIVKIKTNPHMTQLQAKHFLDCVAGKAECKTPGTEAIKAIAVAEAILKAGPGGKAMKVTW